MSLNFNVFGRDVQIERRGQRWGVFYVGQEGKRRVAKDILVPPELAESEIRQYLDDLCHEWATPENSRVIRLD